MSQRLLFRVGCTIFVATITEIFLLRVAQFLRSEYEDDELEPATDCASVRAT